MNIKKTLDKYNSLPVQLRASIWFLICAFLQKGISMVTTPIFTRIMSTSEYGQYGVFSSWLSIISIIVCMNLYFGVHSQGIVKFYEKRNQFTSSLQGLTTVLVTFWTIIYLAFQSFWNNLFSLTSIQMLSMLLIMWTSAIFNFWANEQRLTYSYRSIVIVTFLVSISRPLLELILVMHSEDKVTARIVGWVVIELLAYSWMYIILQKKGSIFFSKKYWWYALTFNIPLIPHYLSAVALNSADRIMIQRMVGDSQAGIYSLAYSLSLIMTLFNSAMMQTISPWMYQKIKHHKSTDIAPVAYITLAVIAGLNLILILLAPEAVAIFAPKTYYEAMWVIPPVAMSVYFMYSYDLFAKFAFYHEKTFVIMVASVMGALLNLVLNFYCIKRFGYMAAGYTTLVCYVFFSVTHYIFMRKICRDFSYREYPYNTKIIITITIPFLITGFLIMTSYDYPIIRCIFVILSIMMLLIYRKKIIKYIKRIIAVKKI